MAENYKDVTILIVDDDEVDVIGIKRAFKKQGILNPVSSVSNGVEALDILRGELLGEPLIVLLDLNMPTMNGFEFLHEIRSDLELKTTIVFVLTTSNSAEDKLSAYTKNVAGYLVKSELGSSFQKLTDLLTAYLRIIEFPESNK